MFVWMTAKVTVKMTIKVTVKVLTRVSSGTQISLCVQSQSSVLASLFSVWPKQFSSKGRTTKNSLSQESIVLTVLIYDVCYLNCNSRILYFLTVDHKAYCTEGTPMNKQKLHHRDKEPNHNPKSQPKFLQLQTQTLLSQVNWCL